jgi:hypothetical protein
VRALRIAVLLLAFVTAAYDAGSIAWAALSVQTAADDAATSAAAEWARTKNVDAAYGAAVTRAEDAGHSVLPTEFTVATDGTVSLVVHGEAHTLVVGRLAPLHEWTVFTADATVKSLL